MEKKEKRVQENTKSVMMFSEHKKLYGVQKSYRNDRNHRSFFTFLVQ